MTRRRSRPRFVASTMCVAASVLVASCGIPLDQEPRDMTASTTTVVGRTPTTETGHSTAHLYFISNAVVTSISDELSTREPTDVLRALVAGQPPGTSRAITTQIPTGTKVLGTKLDNGVLVVDLSGEFNNLVGRGRTRATAQIVLTATELTGVDQVALSLNGRSTQMFSPKRGDVDRVTACDFLSLLPTDQQVAATPVDASERRHMQFRRDALATRCAAGA